MKKPIRNLFRIIFCLTLVISIFGVVNVFADSPVFSVTKVEVIEKTDKTIINKANLSSGLIDNDIVFTDLNDYVKYSVTIKNNTSDDYTIKNISDDNTIPYLEYTYDDLTDVTIKGGEEKTIVLQIKYVQLTSTLVISEDPFNINITYEKEDGTNGSQTIDPVTPDNGSNNNGESNNSSSNTPKTYDGITTYIILGTLSLLGLVLSLKTKKEIAKTFVITGIFSLIALPFAVKAEEESMTLLSIKPNLIRNSYSELIPGIQFNLAISEMSSGNTNLGYEYNSERLVIVDNNYTSGNPEYLYKNNEIKTIKKATLSQYKEVMNSLTNDNIVSTDNSTAPTYVWFDNGTIYYYSHANTIYVNKDASSMYEGLACLSNVDFTSLDTSNVVYMGNMFRGVSSLGTLDLTSFNTSNVEDMKDMFNESYLSSINTSSFDTSNVIYFQGMFNTYSGTSIDVSNFVTSNGRYFNHMFANCSNLQTLDLTNFDTSKAISLAAMFLQNNNLQSVNLSSFNTSKVNDMSYLFMGCNSLATLNLSNFDTRNVLYMNLMFRGVNHLATLDLSNFNTSKVVNMADMFSLTNFTTLNTSSFDTSKVMDMHGMFSGAAMHSVDVSNFDVSNVSNFWHMFSVMPNIEELDLTNFNTRSATKTENMFSGSTELKKIYVSEQFVVDNVTESENMFLSCYSITGSQGTLYDEDHITKEYAHIDDAPTNPGYFWLSSRVMISFDTDGGSKIDPIFINRGSSVGTLPTAVKSDETFIGWYLEDTEITSTYIPTKNITLKAKYKERPVLTSGDGKHTGDIVEMNGEKYIVVSYDANNDMITMIPEYNIYDNGTRLAQDSNDTGVYSSHGISFDEANHRIDSYCTNASYGCNKYLADNVTSSDASIKELIDNYKTQLVSEGLITNSETVRLLTLDELEDLGYNLGARNLPVQKPRVVPSFIHSSTYWLADPNSGNSWDVWFASSNNELSYTNASNTDIGLRPVIEIPKSSIREGYVRANIYSVWVWAGSMAEIRNSEHNMDESISMLNDLNIKEVYLAINPDNLQDDHVYLEKLYNNGIKVYALYGDPIFIDESMYDGVIDYNMNKVAEYNANNAGTSHIEGVHYDIEYYGYKYDGVNVCIDGNTEEAMLCPAREKYAKFVKRAHAKAQELGLKTQYDITIYATNYAFYYDENHDIKNLLDEIIDYTDDIVIMAYGNSPKNTIPSYLFEGDYTYNGDTKLIDKSYIEKVQEKNMNVYVGQELEVFKSTAQELADHPELGPIYLAEYEGASGTEYIYSYNFVMRLFNDLEATFKNEGINNIRITVHDYSQLKELYDNR